MLKTPYKGNYKLDPKQHSSIAKMYASGDFTAEYIAKTYDITVRQVQRIAKKLGVIRTLAESNKLMAKHKHYHHTPPEFKARRKFLTNKKRYQLIAAHPYCTLCGNKVIDSIRLEVDHIDNNPQNNEDSNLQILCNICNQSKSINHRFPDK